MIHLSHLIFLLQLISIYSIDYFSTWFNEQHQEIIDDPLALSVTGSIPQYINGKLARVGPTIYSTKNMNYTNYLDSFGRVSMWTISGKDQTTLFQSAIIRSLLYNSSLSENSISRHISQEKTEPATSPGIFDLNNMDNTDVDVYHFAGSNSFISFTDFHLANEIDLRTLRTIGTVQHNDTAPSGSFFSSSHPGEYIHPVSGQTYLINWLGVKTAKGSRINIYAMGSDLVRNVIGSVEIGFLPYSIHSVLVVGDYVVVFVGPVELDFMKTGINLCISCSTKDHLLSDPSDIYVFSLLSIGLDSADPETQPVSHVQLLPPDSLFVFHYVGGRLKTKDSHQHQSQSGDTILIDVCSYSAMDGVLGDYVLGNLADALDPQTRDKMPSHCNHLTRIELSVPASPLPRPQKPLSIKHLPITDITGREYRPELMSINPLYKEKPYCIVYALSHGVQGSNRYEDIGLLKIDLCVAEGIVDGTYPINTPTVLNIFHIDDVYLGEPIFVPNPDGSDEDSGSLLVMARDGAADKTRLMVIDANSFAVLASIDSPFSLMFEFHGQFWPNESL